MRVLIVCSSGGHLVQLHNLKPWWERHDWHQSSFFADRWRTIISALTCLVDKHGELEQEPSGLARIYGQIAFTHAALGERGPARRWARRTLSLNRRERRTYLALAVSLRLVPAAMVVRLAHAAGKGI